ncbi:MAG: hypothetical protein ACJA09_001002 [Alcanivorax sp.]|jgi:hypothetical protein
MHEASANSSRQLIIDFEPQGLTGMTGQIAIPNPIFLNPLKGA